MKGTKLLTKKAILKELKAIDESLLHECGQSNRCACCMLSSLITRLELEQLPLPKKRKKS